MTKLDFKQTRSGILSRSRPLRWSELLRWLGCVAVLAGCAPHVCGGTTSQKSSEDDRLWEWVAIPAGTYLGCFVPQSGPCESFSAPHHVDAEHRNIAVSGFYIMRTEVTAAAYLACVAANACTPAKTAEKCALGQEAYAEDQIARFGRTDPVAREYEKAQCEGFTFGEKKKRNHPITGVTWQQAANFCAWAGGRLPTGDEWVYLARGGQEGRTFPWGSEWVPGRVNMADNKWCERRGSRRACRFVDNDIDDGWSETAPVGQYVEGASRWGILDLQGNVSEWVDSHENISSQPHYQFKHGRGLRGGNWDNGSYTRFQTEPSGGIDPEHAAPWFGIRCAKTATSATLADAPATVEQQDGILELLRPHLEDKVHSVAEPGSSRTWLRCPLGMTFRDDGCVGDAAEVSFSAAGQACPAEYRLPRFEEFLALVAPCSEATYQKWKVGCGRCSSEETKCFRMFNGLKADHHIGRYWTSSTGAPMYPDDEGGLNVDLEPGNVKWSSGDQKLNVWCVK